MHGGMISLSRSEKSEARPQKKSCVKACANSGKWSEKRIAYALATGYFKSRSVVFIPNCIWTGAEADVLVVEMSRKLIDVEIKISRADFKADARKQKWWHVNKVKKNGVWTREKESVKDWPDSVWKHIYVLPKEEWREDLLEHMASDKSGIVLIEEIDGRIIFTDYKKPVKNKDALILTERQVLDIARLANVRMWQTYRDIEASTTWRVGHGAHIK